MRLSLKQASLLEASSELRESARHQLLDQVSQNPAAADAYRAAHENFSLLSSLPIPEPSARERQAIPARIKHALHQALRQREKRAGRAHLFIRCAAGTLALAAGIALCATLVDVNRANHSRQREQLAAINALIDRVTLLSDPSATAYDRDVSDVEASIRQLQTESPTLSYLHDKDMGNLFNALAAVPDEINDPMTSDPSAPPGSF